MVKEDPINPIQSQLLKIDAEYGGDCPDGAASIFKTTFAGGTFEVFPTSIRRKASSRHETYKRSIARSINNPPGYWKRQEFPKDLFDQLSPNPRIKHLFRRANKINDHLPTPTMSRNGQNNLQIVRLPNDEQHTATAVTKKPAGKLPVIHDLKMGFNHVCGGLLVSYNKAGRMADDGSKRFGSIEILVPLLESEDEAKVSVVRMSFRVLMFNFFLT